MPGYVTGTPKTLLRFEGLFVLVLAVAAYAQWGAGWKWFAIFFLVPDLSMLGYLGGRKIGAAAYNLGHWYAGPIACLAYGMFAHAALFLSAGLIWAAHIGFDRLLG